MQSEHLLFRVLSVSEKNQEKTALNAKAASFLLKLVSKNWNTNTSTAMPICPPAPEGIPKKRGES